ncbi:uncharacterized protein IL334_007608 [Kwoniella shivajii]|uniref:Autophagy-related protein 13 n=1 Tax=Kwoniella shivajii TaxID=564305 RepID=A0ABZ1DB96_9TREE|nr:hypothetical protein IL334_007608 [Kwoniella shivajii]
MSFTPTKPHLTTAPSSSSSTRSPNPNVLLAQTTGERNLASSSTSSSQIGPSQTNRSDQVLYRFYLKTVGVLVDGRLTHYGGAVGKKTGEKKKDKWFNLILPEVDLYKSDLQLYRSISSYHPYSESGSSPSPESCTIPPLLIAFTLDTSDIPNGQALLWNRGGGKIPLDVGLAGKGKGKEKEKKTGIVLERWTFRAQLPLSDIPYSSQLAPHTAYRIGIIHFRALFSLIRLLPAYRLFRRLRRSNNGLRMGLKLWGPEGFPNTPEGLVEAWEIMERGLVGLDTGLDNLVSSEAVPPEEIEQYDFPKLDLFGNEYTLTAEYRPEVDFHIEDMEAVLSEKFVDMDEDWFTPTVSRRNTEDESNTTTRSASNPSRIKPETNRKSSLPTPIISNNSPIPQRQPALAVGSLVSAGGGSFSATTRPGGSRVPSSHEKRGNVGSIGTDRWSSFAEGLPFAGQTSLTSQGQEPPSPNMATPAAIVAARRLSGHSIQPFASASPSTSLLRSTPPQAYVGSPIPVSSARPVMGSSRPSSVGRTSSFLSQSGRSFTHAQLANMYAGSASPPVTGAMSGMGVQIPTSSPAPGQSPVSPSSLSFTKQPVPRSISGRPLYMTPSASSPFIPESLERESPLSSASGAPGIIKRYSSSLSQRSGRAVSGPAGGSMTMAATSGSQGGSGGEGSLPGSVGQGLLRRTSTRESGLRHSLEGPSVGRMPVPDEDDIQAFLKTLEALPQPPSLVAQAIQSSRSHLPSTSSSLSAPSVPLTPSPLLTSASGSPGNGGTATANMYGGRIPMTRQQVDDELKRMAGSFSNNTLSFGPTIESEPSSIRASSSNSTNPSSIGLLSASRPSSANRRVSNLEINREPPSSSRPMYRRQTSGEKSPLGPGSIKSPVRASPMQPLKSADGVNKHSLNAQSNIAARSLPGRGRASDSITVLDEEHLSSRAGTGASSVNPIGVPGMGILSPQNTGGTANNDSIRSRRGPVLLRGGFGDSNVSGRPTTATSSPSHSPVRDITHKATGVGLGIRENQGQSQGGQISRGMTTIEGDETTSSNNIGGYVIGGFKSPYSRRLSAVSSSSITPGPNSSNAATALTVESGGGGAGGISGYPGLPTPSSRSLKEQRTAPSSLGREEVPIGVGMQTGNNVNPGLLRGRTFRSGSEAGIGRLSEDDLEGKMSGIDLSGRDK